MDCVAYISNSLYQQTPTCRHQNHSGEEAHLLLTEAQVHELLTEVKHGIEQVPGTHGPQGVHAVFLPTQKCNSAVLHVKQGRETNHQHLQNTNTVQSPQVQLAQWLLH